MLKHSQIKSLLLLFALIMGVGSNAWGADSWVKTDPANLVTGDIVVIVDQATAKAMSNSNGTSKAPSATAVTLSTDKSEITGEVAATLQWEVTKDESSYKFGVSGTTNYLYCTATNNGVRVGTGERNTFTVVVGGDNNGYYLYNEAESDKRWIGCYNGSDWRCYGSINSNIKGNNNAFYKKVSTVDATLVSIAISGTYPTTFYAGDDFSYEGMTVTATYDDESTKNVTSKATYSGYDMATAGTQEVTVSYTENEVTKTATYNITVNELPKFTVTLGDGGSIAQEVAGAAIVLPTRDDVDDYIFAGWSETNVATATTTAPTIIPAGNYTPKANITLYPVYKMTETSDKTTDEWIEIKEAPADGEYAICSASYFMKAAVSSSRFANGGAPQISGGKLTVAPANDCIWNIYKATDGNYRIKNGTNYAGATGSNNQGALLTDETANYAKWTISYSSGFSIENVGMASASKNKTLRNNGTYGWGTYGASTGDAPRLFQKNTVAVQTVYYWSSPVADTRADANISFADATVTKEIVDSYTGQALTNPNNVSPITWTSSDEKVATVENGTVTVKAVGTTTITATFAGDEDYKKATASYTLTVQDSRIALDLSFAETAVDVNIGESVAAPALSGNAGEGAVTYTSADETIAEVNASTGEVTGVAEGTTTITATVAEVSGYQGGTATFTVTVYDPTKPGTKVNPYTVAQARDAIDNDGDVTGVYVKGIISQIDSYNSGAITYWISDDGTTTDQFEVYKGKGLNGDKFTAKSDLQLGDEVVVTGNITLYGTSTYEFSTNSELVSLTRKEAAVITVANGTEQTVDRTKGEEELTLTATANSGATVVFTIDTDNTTLTEGTDFGFNTDEFLFYTKKSGVIVVKANAPAAGDYLAATEVTITITVIGEKEEPVIVVQNETIGYGETYTVDDSMIEGGDITVTSSNTEVATVEGLVITAKAVGTTTITVATAENSIYKAGSETFTLTVTAPEGSEVAATSEIVFKETFDKCKSTGGNDGTWANISSGGTLSSATDNTGWVCENGYAASACARFGTSSKKGSATTPALGKAGTLILTFRAGAWRSDTNLTLNLSVTEGEIDKSSVTLTQGEFSTYTATITNATADTKIKFEAAQASSNRFFLDDVVVKTAGVEITATLNDDGYATFCSQYPLDFTAADGYTAWQITDVSETEITFSKITGSIKGGQGILLKGEAGATVTLTSADSNVTLSDNLLEGTTAPLYVAANEYYGLWGKTFVRVSAGTIPAGKALLDAGWIPSTARQLSFAFDGETTGISDATRQNGEMTNVYDLQGRRVDNTQFSILKSQIKPGLYIVNGKKVVMK